MSAYDVVLSTITEALDRQRATLVTADADDDGLRVTDYLNTVHQAVQALYLTSAITRIQAMIPTATAFTVTTSDQDYYGFVLDDVELPDGTQLASIDEDLLDKVRDDVWSDLGSIDWQGPIRNSRAGHGRVFMDGTSEPLS